MLAPGPRVVTRMAPKRVRQEETKERKALAAAKLEKQIEKELVNRLKSGNYTEEMLNVNEEIWKKVLDQRAKAENGELEDVEEEEGDDEENVEFVSDDGELISDDDELADWFGGEFEQIDEEADSSHESEEESEEEESSSKGNKAAGGSRLKRKISRVEIEYEYEGPEREPVLA
jgi:protein MAK16